jgi:hypothetical protein
VSPAWEIQYPLVSVRTLVRGVSDHAALLLDTGVHQKVPHKPFKFELCWFTRADLHDRVSNIWHSRCSGKSNLDRWHSRFANLRKNLKGWNLNIEGEYKRERDTISRHLDYIDKQSEFAELSATDYEYRCYLQNKLNQILREEEIKWLQRAKERDLFEGDRNARYFMIKASGRKRKSEIFRLCQDEGVIEGDKNILVYATGFYKKIIWSS